MKHWIVLMIVMFGSVACMPQTTATEVPPPEVMVAVEPFVEPTPTPDCQHADGVTLEVIRISDTGVTVRASGLQPGEIPYITYSAFGRSSSARMEAGRFVKGADAQGNFSDAQELMPPQGEISATWEIRFTHARGVECATITLP